MNYFLTVIYQVNQRIKRFNSHFAVHSIQTIHTYMYVQIVHGTLYTEKIVQCTMYCTTVVHNTAVVFILLTLLSYNENNRNQKYCDNDPLQHLSWLGRAHRRWKETEEKAKVVSSVSGAKYIQFLASLAVLPRSI